MNFPILPLAIQGGVGALDGFVASTDVNSGRTGQGILKQRAFYVQVGAVAAGLVGELLNLHPDITEPLMGTGVALIGRELTFQAAQKGQATPAPAQGYTQWIPAPAAQGAGFLGQQAPMSAVA